MHKLHPERPTWCGGHAHYGVLRAYGEVMNLLHGVPWKELAPFGLLAYRSDLLCEVDFS